MNNFTRYCLSWLVVFVLLIPVMSLAQDESDNDQVDTKGAPPMTRIVTDPGDSGADTLRQAVLDSNPGDTIEFDLVGPSPHTITLTSGEILINKQLTINGLGKEDLIISGNNNSRVFNIDAGGAGVSVIITNLTISDGDARSASGRRSSGISTRGAPPVNQKGGGIYNVENLTLEDCIMTNNTSGGDVDGGGGALATRGGLVFIRRCHFLSNQDIDLTNDSFGGAIDMQPTSALNTGFMLIEDSKFNNNSSQADSGSANGGAIYISRGPFLTATPPANISRTSFTNNFAQADMANGGAIMSDSGRLTMTNIVVLANEADGSVAGTGGGFYVFQQGSTLAILDLLNSTVSQNIARGELARGGGLYLSGANVATQIIPITNGTISENAVEAISGSGIPRGLGGAIYIDDARLDLLASTMVFNEARGPDGSELSGAGMFASGSLPTIRYRNDLIVGNTFAQGGGARVSSASVTTRGPTPVLLVPNCAFEIGSAATTYQQNGTSNITDSDLTDDQCRFSFNPDFDPSTMLGPLENNGGFTLTHALLDTQSPTNPAIDAIPDGDCTNAVSVISRRINNRFDKQMYFANSYPHYPYFELSYEPLFVNYINDELIMPISDLPKYSPENDLGIGVLVSKISSDNELRGLPPAMENPNDGRPFPRPFDWFNTGTALCDVGSFELQPEGLITIEKVSNPAGETRFQFEGTTTPQDRLLGCDLDGTFSLDDGEATSGCILPQGTYNIEETNDQGLPFLVIDCGQPTANVTIDNPNSTVAIEIINDGDEAFCTFINSIDPVLTVVHQGTGTGVSQSQPVGIDCPNDSCVQDFPGGTDVTLTAVADLGSVFDGWSGDCPATAMSQTTITLNANATCIATFSLLPPVTLDVTILGPGQGGVTSASPGIDCSNTGAVDCDETYDIGTSVTLTATPEPGSMFVTWGGDAVCIGDPANPVLTLNMTTDVSCTAMFSLPPPPVTLDVTIAGNGDGGVVSTNLGIDCSSTGATDCDETYMLGTGVTLTATALPGSTFTGWSGDAECTGDPLNPMLNLTMNSDISCIATFIVTVPQVVTLTVEIEGPGTGTVTSEPVGIDCLGDCTEVVAPGTTFTLTATPAPNSTFIGWSEDCTGTDSETVITVNVDSLCVATFVLNEFVLNPIFPALDDNINFISAEHATPNRNVAFAWAKKTGSLRIGGRVCNGISLGLNSPKLLSIVPANDFGIATHIFYIPFFNDFEFELQLQAVDISTCRTSNIVPQVIRKDESG